MIDVRDGVVSFVFANEDMYLLPSLVEMDLYQYLCYSLYEQGIRNVFILRAGADGYYLSIQDEESERMLNETKLPGIHLLSKYGRLYSRERTEKIDWDCEDLDQLIDCKIPTLLRQRSHVAVIFELETFHTVLRDDNLETLNNYVGLMERAREQGNAIVLVGPVQDARIHSLLAGPESVFRFTNEKGHSLCREMHEILEDPSNPPLYREMKRRLGSRCSWLNMFSGRRVRTLLRRMWIDHDDLIPDEREIAGLAAMVSQWYAEPAVRARYGELLGENRLRRFTDLRNDLRKADIMFGLRKKTKAMADAEPEKAIQADSREWEKNYVGAVAENVVTEALRAVRISAPVATTEEAAELRTRLDQMIDAYGSPRVNDAPGVIQADIEKTVYSITKAADRGDLQTVSRALDVLEYAQKKNFSFDNDTIKIWKCRTAIVTVMENISRLNRLKAEDKYMIGEYRARKQAIYRQQDELQARTPGLDDFLDRMAAGLQVDYYSELGQQALEYCRLADKGNKVNDQLKACIAKYTYHMKAYDQEEDKLDQLTNASRSAITVRAVSVSQLLGEVGSMEKEAMEEAGKSSAQEMYDIKQSLDMLSDAAMSSGLNYVDTLRRFQQMKREETGAAD